MSKLVRDKIPEIILKNDGKVDEETKQLLKAIDTDDNEDILEESAGVIEVIHSLLLIRKDLEETRKNRFDKNKFKIINILPMMMIIIPLWLLLVYIFGITL
jgi:predicted house-cleaning noncanonical NTP pyrophosphatase (MazG superfamily)